MPSNFTIFLNQFLSPAGYIEGVICVRARIYRIVQTSVSPDRQAERIWGPLYLTKRTH